MVALDSQSSYISSINFGSLISYGLCVIMEEYDIVIGISRGKV